MKTLLSPSMQEATNVLIDNLLASEAFILYQQALTRLNNDHQARAILEQLSQAQANLRKKQADGTTTQADIDTLRALHEQVQRNSVITNYAQTQQNAINQLQEINDEISQLLGINFASFANHTTC